MMRPDGGGLLCAVLWPCAGGNAQTTAPGAGAVTPLEVQAFTPADANRDGLLSFSEFRLFVRQMAAAGQSTAITIRTFGACRLAYRRGDADRNGLATPGELRRADTGFRAEN